MATDVSICNMSLGHIKSKSTIASLDEKKNAEARVCKLYYAQARDETLEEFNWPFAKRTAVLATVGEAPLGWAFEYAYPADCIAVRKILTTYRTDDPLPYELMHSELSDSLVILTDEEAAQIEYTKRVENTTLFSSLFTMALSHKIGSYIAMPLSGKDSMRDAQISLFDIVISKARASALNQEQKDEQPDANWITARD